MYNLFVTAQEGAWDTQGYEFDRSRFLEYTPDDVAARFKDLKISQLDALHKLPCLFAYEGKEPMRVGSLISIKIRGRALLIEFNLDQSIPPIPYDAIAPIQMLLDIRDWEMNRTHWAVKDKDLFEGLRSAGLLPQDVEAPPPEGLPELEPTDREVDSVGAFITTVLGLTEKGKEIFYRGHSSRTKYRLEPSVFRKDTAGNYKAVSNNLKTRLTVPSVASESIGRR